MFKKILIANRGEIACRVIKSARKMGITTVAVFSDADRQALHVKMADEAVHIGPAPSAESYLVIDHIIEACKTTGAEAVHPGYGFLSENAAFTEALESAGIVFIGPGTHAIKMMGDKITSKKLAAEAGVNTIPGFQGIIQSPEHAVEMAGGIGYPVMLKASAGGGGKGMRVVWNDDECQDGFIRATNEAKSSFGDDRVLAEKYIEEPRHIEIQVMADSHGNVLYLNERECSIQRRHQKVIEEAPSPFLDEATRKAMGEQAVALARAVDYRSAGTVEFIVDSQRNFYFLEMNTRLQVEHPITEFVTGLDLVELMIKVAAGEKLPLAQNDVQLKGWAVEARVYAEDPFRNFMPSIGRLANYRPPAETNTVRVDTGIEEGSEVSMYYDPMIAKLVTYGESRPEAVARMQSALDQYYIRGVAHNISFLNSVLAHPRFKEGRLSTNFIAEEYSDGFHASDAVPEDPGLLFAVVAAIHRKLSDRESRISGQLPGYEGAAQSSCAVLVGQEAHPLEVTHNSDGLRVRVGESLYRIVTTWQPGEPLINAEVNGEALTFQLDRIGTGYRLSQGGHQIDAMVVEPRTAELAAHMPEKMQPDLSKYLISPMPGLLVRLTVGAGQEVKAGEELAVVEAMKMENSLRASDDVKIAKVLAEQGQSLVVDQPILEFE